MYELLKGKTAIVTGAASGMGKKIAQIFIQHGANVIFADINEEGLKDAVSSLPTDKAIPVKVDVTNKSEVEHVVQKAVKEFNQIDILINCAGIHQVFTPIEELAENQWDKTLDINLKSIYLFVKYVTPYMKQRKDGVVINIASIAGVRARPGLNAYSASKGGAILLTKALAIELAGYNIRVNAINPGPTETPMINKFIGEDNGDLNEEKQQVFIDSIPLGTLIETKDIANSTLFLASEWARKITGSVLNVDGGRGI